MFNVKSSRRTLKEQSFKTKSLNASNLCNVPYRSFQNTSRIHGEAQNDGPRQISYHSECSKLILIDFALNGRFLACISVKDNVGYQDPLTSSRNLSPTSQLMLLKANNYTPNPPAETNNFRLRQVPSGDEFNNDLSMVASINLDLVEVYCTEISNDTTQFAVYGFGYNTMPRKPAISVYEIHYDIFSDSVSLSRKTKLVFEKGEILYSKLTACKFFPTDGNILVTAICDDYHSVRKSNYLDFWNTKSSLHFARFDLLEKAPKFQGYVTSMSFSSDGLILAMTSSSQHCQCLLYSTQSCQFGAVFSQTEYTYKEQEDHFPVFSAFATNLGDYELLVCTFHGEYLRLRVDPNQLKVTSVISHTNLFNLMPSYNIPGESGHILGFRYCKATSRYLIRMQKALAFIDANSNTIDRVVKFQSESTHNSPNGYHFSLSKTGQELAVITNNILRVHCYQNPDFSLKNCCRESIIKLVSEDKISQLPLPKILKSFLLYNS